MASKFVSGIYMAFCIKNFVFEVNFKFSARLQNCLLTGIEAVKRDGGEDQRYFAAAFFYGMGSGKSAGLCVVY